MMKKVYNYWEEASGTAKYLIILAVAYTIMSIILIVLCNDRVADEYYGAAEPPVRCGESHLSGLTEPPHLLS